MISELKAARSVTEWAVIAGLQDEARRQAASASDERSFATALADHKHHTDAVLFLAHLLPNREAVLWAWLCAKASIGASGTVLPPFSASLAATEKWIAEPNDENRRAAMAAAQEADIGTAAGAAGLAAFLSGESLAPAGAHPVPPTEFLTARAVAASVMLSAVATEPEKAPVKYGEFLDRGFEIAQRIQLWDRIAGLARKEA